MEQAAGCRILAAPARHVRRHEVGTLNLAVRIVPVAAGQKLPAVHGRRGSCLRCRWPGKMDQPARQAPAEAAREAAARDMDVQLASAVERARAVVDLAGSYTARRGAFLVSVQADLAGDSGAAGDLATALEEFLKAVRSEVGGESRPGLKWRIRMILRRD